MSADRQLLLQGHVLNGHKDLGNNGWTDSATLLADHADPNSEYSPEFARSVVAGLPAAIPVTRVVDALVFIANDPASPYEDIEALYRSARHLTRGDGRYLAHQILRRTMGVDPIVVWAGGGTEPVQHRAYLDSLLSAGDYDWDGDVDGADFLIWQREFIRSASASTAVPEPTALTLMASSMLLVFGGKREKTL